MVVSVCMKIVVVSVCERVWWLQYVRECGGVSMYKRVWWCQYVRECGGVSMYETVW